MFYLIVDTGVKALQKIHMRLTVILILHVCVCACVCVYVSVCMYVCAFECACVFVLHVVVFTSYNVRCLCHVTMHVAWGSSHRWAGIFFVSKSFIVYLGELSKSHSVIK